MYRTHINDEITDYAALTIQAHTNGQPNCRRYAVSDRSILLEVETDLTGAHCQNAAAGWWYGEQKFVGGLPSVTSSMARL